MTEGRLQPAQDLDHGPLGGGERGQGDGSACFLIQLPHRRVELPKKLEDQSCDGQAQPALWSGS